MASYFMVWGAILATWSLLVFLFAGMGLFLFRRLRLQPTPLKLVCATFLGYCFTIALLQCWHFLFPIGTAFGFVVAAVGTAGWLSVRRHWGGLWSAFFSKTTLQWVAPALLITIWVANRSLGPNNEIDSHLYHIPTMLWYQAYPIVPGLGNLYLPLASNSSSLLVAAWLDSGPWHGHAYHVVNGFLISGLFWHAFAGIALLLKNGLSDRASGLFRVLSLVPAVQMSNHWMVSGYSTDVAPAVLVLVAAAELFALLTASLESVAENEPERIEPAFSALAVAVLLSAALCCKLTALFFAAVGMLVAVGALFRWGRKLQRPVWKTTAAGGLLSLCLVVPWLGRGAILSGYPLYPVTSPSVNADWKVPAGLVEKEKFYQMMRNRLRQFYDWGNEDAIRSLAGWGWIRYWVRLLEQDTLVPAGLFLGGCVVAWRLRRSETCNDGLWRGWMLLVPACAAILFWFLTQAEQRMGFFLFWVIASTAVGLTGARLLHGRSITAVRVAVALIVVLGCVNIKKTHIAPSDDRGLHAGLSAPLMEPFQTDWGLTIWRPAGGNPLCSNAPLPATPVPNKQLRLRSPGDYTSGFRIEPKTNVNALAQHPSHNARL